MPLVLDNEVGTISKTSEAVKLLKRYGLYEDVQRVVDGKKIKTGKAKVRGSRYKVKRGPLFVVTDECE